MRLSRVKADPFLTEDKAGIYRQDNHMFHFATSNGCVFYAGPSRAMYWISTAGNGSTTWAENRSDDGHAMNGNAVLFDVGKILTTGGAPNYAGGLCTRNAYVIDISAGPGGNVMVERTARMLVARALHSSVVLPSGEVVVVARRIGQPSNTTEAKGRRAALGGFTRRGYCQWVLSITFRPMLWGALETMLRGKLACFWRSECHAKQLAGHCEQLQHSTSVDAN
jgi:hypothetical protein